MNKLSTRNLIAPTLAALMLLSMLSGCLPAGHVDSIPPHISPSKPTTVPVPTPYDPLAIPPEITEKGVAVFYARARIAQSADTQLCLFGAFDSIYAVLVRDTANPGEPYWETVNGLTFYYPDGYPIFLENGVCYDSFGGHLWDMFHRQLITEEQLQEIYDNYYSVYPELLYLANGQLEFGPEEMEAISQALLELTGEEVDWDDVNQYNKPRLEYYCSIMGAHVFAWIPYGHNPFPEYRTITVGSYSFTHAELFWLYVYVGGELWTLNEAYDRGFFTDAQLETISFYHYSTNPVYFDN